MQNDDIYHRIEIYRLIDDNLYHGERVVKIFLGHLLNDDKGAVPCDGDAGLLNVPHDAP